MTSHCATTFVLLYLLMTINSGFEMVGREGPNPSQVRNPTCLGLQTTHRTVIMVCRLICLVYFIEEVHETYCWDPRFNSGGAPDFLGGSSLRFIGGHRHQPIWPRKYLRRLAS